MDEPRANMDSSRLKLGGKPPPSPQYYSLCLAMGLAPKCHFVPGLPSGSPEIIKIRTPMILEAHNFV